MNIYGSTTLYNYYRLMRHFARLLFMLPMKHGRSWLQRSHRVTMHLPPGSALTSSVPSADRKWKLGELGLGSLGTASHEVGLK